MIRLHCVVPFCRRTRGDRKSDKWPITPQSEWICGDHWRNVDRRLKRLRRANLRRMWHIPDAGERVHRWLWRSMKRQAIERAL